MNEWYYTQNNERQGPVTREQLISLLSSGTLNPNQTLVWRSGLDNWVNPAAIPELHPQPTSPPPAAFPTTATGTPQHAHNPYAAPAAAPVQEEVAPLELPEQAYPSLDLGFCLSTAWEFLKDKMGLLVGAAAIFMGINLATGFATQMLAIAIDGLPPSQAPGGVAFQGFEEAISDAFAASLKTGAIIKTVLDNLVQLFLQLGLVSLTLNLLRNKNAQVTDIFSQANSWFPAFIGYILYWLIVCIAGVFLILPGIWIACRLAYYQYAIVEKGLNPIEALKYSYRLTRGNALWIFLTLFVSGIIAGLGILLCGVGILWSMPLGALIVTASFLYLHGGPGLVAQVTRPIYPTPPQNPGPGQFPQG